MVSIMAPELARCESISRKRNWRVWWGRGERPVTADTMVPMGDREARPLSSCSWWSCVYLSIRFTLPTYSFHSRVRAMVLLPSTSLRLMHIDSFPQTSHHLHHTHWRRLSNILLQNSTCEITTLQRKIASYLEKIQLHRVGTNNKNKNVRRSVTNSYPSW